ncbi:16S rRNA (cytidine(1402)-2'-O)-methyltransferase [Halobacteriovorax marinus]|uniref:16S rRNA (cytidine(1402)-2'-O)-methyltransferase n=1 Tax=Halobacteriovorax marinus TaxID=97084 RepID=UPI003A90F674
MSTLKLVTLPIGNLSDITPRALETLKNERLFLAEDTRNLRKIFDLLGVDGSQKNVDSFHDHSKDKVDYYVTKMKSGHSYVLVSDAGSPVISDPAFPLVRACIDAGIEIETAPGVSAVTTALELSGLPPQPFTFYGFTPRDDSKKREFFTSLLSQSGTFIFFESPHRLMKTLKVLEQVLPDSDIAVARELTKKFETIYRFKAKDFESIEIKSVGEIVLLIHHEASAKSLKSKKLEALALDYLDKKQNKKNLSKLLAEILDENSKDIYQKLSRD